MCSIWARLLNGVEVFLSKFFLSLILGEPSTKDGEYDIKYLRPGKVSYGLLDQKGS